MRLCDFAVFQATSTVGAYDREDFYDKVEGGREIVLGLLGDTQWKDITWSQYVKCLLFFKKSSSSRVLEVSFQAALAMLENVKHSQS